MPEEIGLTISQPGEDTPLFEGTTEQFEHGVQRLPLVLLADSLFNGKKELGKLQEQLRNSEDQLIKLMLESDLRVLKTAKCVATLHQKTKLTIK